MQSLSKSFLTTQFELYLGSQLLTTLRTRDPILLTLENYSVKFSAILKKFAYSESSSHCVFNKHREKLHIL